MIPQYIQLLFENYDKEFKIFTPSVVNVIINKLKSHDRFGVKKVIIKVTKNYIT